MAQRLGRVNRRGEGEAEVDVVYEADHDTKPKSPQYEAARWATKALLERLPDFDSDRDASPLALGTLINSLNEQERDAAFAPKPTILPVSDILFDGWALTTIRDSLPGRPHVEPYLHGLADWEPAGTQVAWREEVEVLDSAELQEFNPPEELLDDYPLIPHELLKEPSYRVQGVSEVGRPPSGQERLGLAGGRRWQRSSADSASAGRQEQ